MGWLKWTLQAVLGAFVTAGALIYVLPRRTKRSWLVALLRSGPSPTPLAVKPYPERVLSHGPLRQLGSFPLWIVRGTLPQPGPQFGRNMLVYRNVTSGKLWVHSPVCVDATTKERLEGLGQIQHIVVPNSFHRLDADAFAQEYPEAALVCPSDSMGMVLDVTRVDRAVEDEFDHVQEDSKAAIQFTSPKGIVQDFPGMGELLFVLDLGQQKSAMILCDLFFNLNPDESNGFMNIMAKGFGPTKFGQYLMLNESKGFHEWISRDLMQLAEQRNVEVLAVAHGDVVIGHKNVMNCLAEASEKVKPS